MLLKARVGASAAPTIAVVTHTAWQGADPSSPAASEADPRLAIAQAVGGQLIAVTSTASTSTNSGERSWAVPRGLLTAIRSADGHRVWQVTLPAVVSFPLLAAPGGLLVYAAAVRLPC